LTVLFILLPYTRINGKPPILLDLPHREFTLFGRTFLPTDTLLLMLLVLSILITVFLLTALFGRVWCGWGCPQTVYLEFVFRPIERWIEGGRSGSLAIDRLGARGHFHPRRLAKYAVYFILSLFLAHIFLAYFVGVDQLAVWMRRSPVEHPTSFAVMAGTTIAMMINFTWLREQVCMLACPYGRIQSVMLDHNSLVVAYDRTRGEPRAKGRTPTPGAGDCIDCGACVTTCPTGIDIRDGLQMECIHCTQCADACDDVMRKVGRPTGLIRYSSYEILETGRRHLLRPRVVLYPTALACTVGGLIFTIRHADPADVTVLRGVGAPYTIEPDARVANQLRVRITNRTGRITKYRIAIDGLSSDAAVIAPENPLEVETEETATSPVFVMSPSRDFHGGQARIVVRVSDDEGFQESIPYTLIGPQDAPPARSPQ